MIEIKVLSKHEFVELIPSYVELNNKIFNLKVNEDYYVWRYLNNPNEDLLVSAALDNGVLVANYSASAFQLLDSKKNYLKSAQSLNTMTDPNYQGQGLFVKTANKLFQEMQRRDYDLIWGFPNNLSHWVFKNRLSWKDIYEYPTLSLKVGNTKQYQFNNIKNVNESNIKTLSFSNYFLDNHYQIDKTREYLKWRYIDNPLNKYYFYYYDKDANGELSDFIIMKIYDSKLNIVELQAESEEVMKELINFSIHFAVESELEYVTIWSSINSTLYNVLESNGFWLDLPTVHLGARFFNKKVEDNFRWNISQGDNNVF